MYTGTFDGALNVVSAAFESYFPESYRKNLFRFLGDRIQQCKYRRIFSELLASFSILNRFLDSHISDLLELDIAPPTVWDEVAVINLPTTVCIPSIQGKMNPDLLPLGVFSAIPDDTTLPMHLSSGILNQAIDLVTEVVRGRSLTTITRSNLRLLKFMQVFLQMPVTVRRATVVPSISLTSSIEEKERKAAWTLTLFFEVLQTRSLVRNIAEYL
jgi:hypothetical protein